MIRRAKPYNNPIISSTMPLSDPKAGSLYICAVSSILLFSVIAGGALLIMYLILPVTNSWFPIAGVALVSLPWLFWFLTFLYRIIRHCCCPSTAVAVDNGSRASQSRSRKSEAVAIDFGDKEEAGVADLTVESPRTVRFGGEVVVGVEPQNGGDMESEKMNLSNVARSCSVLDMDNSVASHESEIPLTSSMTSS